MYSLWHGRGDHGHGHHGHDNSHGIGHHSAELATGTSSFQKDVELVVDVRVHFAYELGMSLLCIDAIAAYFANVTAQTFVNQMVCH